MAGRRQGLGRPAAGLEASTRVPWLRVCVAVALLGLAVALTSPAAGQTPPPGTDATLSGLELSEGRLSPPFAAGVSSYAATVMRITVTPTTADESATVAYLDGADAALADADTAVGFQVDLDVGDNTVKVRVTAEDGVTVSTYTLTVTRAEEDLSLGPPATDPVAALPSTAVYSISFTGRWTTAVTPGGVPSGAHFSPLIGAVHGADATFLASGETASAGIESMAEVGGTTALASEVNAATGADPPTALSVIRRPGNVSRTGTATISSVRLTTEFPRVTLTSMVAPSHDWFVGVAGMGLLDASGLWLRSREVDLFPWDAGTENGTDFSLGSPGTPTNPQWVITSIRGTGPFTTGRIATLSFTLQSASTTLSVDENTAAGEDIGDPAAIAGADGAVTYTLGGTDAASFDIVSTTGQIQTKAALDYETRSSYEVTVTATDSSGAVPITVTIEVLNVAELLSAMEGPESVDFAENGAGRVATYTASSDADRDLIIWALSGDDADQFSVDTPGGALRFDAEPTPPNLSTPLPDFEDPADSDAGNDYDVTLTASVGTDTISVDVTVTVTDEDENGLVALSPVLPKAGAALTATLSDPDGITSGTTAWTWERSTGLNQWASIDGATTASYTPVAADTNAFLRVTATYDDEHDSGHSVEAVTPEVVIGPQLTSLSVSTDDSTAESSRALFPSFDADVLHYGIGCDSDDTMTLMLSAAAGARLAVQGTQVASGSASVSVPVGVESDVQVTVANADGARTNYVVHCLSAIFFDFEIRTTPGVTGPLGDLLAFDHRSHMGAFDHNGVPRLRWNIPATGGFGNTGNLRFHRIANGDYRFSYSQNQPDRSRGVRFTVLDQNLQTFDASVTVAAPIRHTDGHDFQILPNGNYLLMSYEPATRNLSSLTFMDSSSTAVAVWDSVIQIVTPAGRALFTWSSWDHMALEDCVQHRFPLLGPERPPPDVAAPGYAHINSFQLVDGVIVGSFRGCGKVLGIDATNGDVVWRLGPSNLSEEEWEDRDIGPAPMSVVKDPLGEFCGQHTA
ncbi:MAG: hypothetical protein F4018_19495, partial [Acidobacteria bacterium]|nr:hypothetical protein [Acidobacteriota bacterium]